MTLDATDKRLLAHLQRDGRVSTKDLAAQANMSVSPCWRRVRRLEEMGVIKKYAAVLDRKQLGLNAMAYVHVSLMDHKPATIEAFDLLVQSDDQVIECSSITGESDYVLKVVARDPECLEAFIMKRLLAPGLVRASMTNFILRNTKTGPALPLD